MEKLYIGEKNRVEQLSRQETEFIKLGLQGLRNDFRRHKEMTDNEQDYIDVSLLMAKLKIF